MSESKRAIRLQCLSDERGNGAIEPEQVRQAIAQLASLPTAIAGQVSFPPIGSMLLLILTIYEVVGYCCHGFKRAPDRHYHASQLRDDMVLQAQGKSQNQYNSRWPQMGGTKSGQWFEQARIMTFGYTSGLMDRKAKNNLLADYSIQLLRKLQQLRGKDMESAARPLLLVCHSMGGLVARNAMSLIQKHPTEYPGFSFDRIGLAFLSTPHFGSTLADWGKYIAFLNHSIGIRNEIMRALRTINPSTIDDMEAWNKMRPQPIVRCFCEADNTVWLKSKPWWPFKPSYYIVTPTSATFLRPAQVLLGTDHHTVCRFSPTDGHWGTVKAEIEDLGAYLTERWNIGRYIARGSQLSYGPGYPSPAPGSCPPAAGRKFNFDSDPEPNFFFVGRGTSIHSLRCEFLQDPECQRQLWVALLGTGGIGKTEILRQVSKQYRNDFHVFFLQATDSATLQQASHKAATEIGHEILVTSTFYAGALERWSRLQQEERIQEFNQWVSRPKGNCLLVLDDLDGIETASMLAQAPRAIFSSRNRNSVGQSYIHPIDIPKMDDDEVDQLLRSLPQQPKPTQADLLAVGEIAQGHPLTVRCILERMRNNRINIQGFIDQFRVDSQDCVKQLLLRTRLPSRDTIMESFRRFFDHMALANVTLAHVFFDIIAFTSPVFGSTSASRYREFEVPEEYLGNCRGSLKDSNLLSPGSTIKNQLLREFARVSLAKTGDGQDFEIHPIWIECQRHACKPPHRIECLRQVMAICDAWHRHGQQHEQEAALYFMNNAFHLGTAFHIQDRELASGTVTLQKISEWRAWT
ncbi:hypothetical protein FPHYL_3011 [Fusarium phyllophilum]|uniref:Uncharacterized protein n=1 Tax=Fusarium phyllophilum TaxID=47803 RepID=A0A8H5K8M6_9HYPO|nr:hypothetical protein FPHYL_3011 [Fusarium phyllophilum]